MCRHKNVVVAYAGVWRFAGSIYGGAVAEGAIRPPCLMAYVARGVAVGGFVGVGAGECMWLAVLKGQLMWTCEEGGAGASAGFGG